MNAGVDLHLPGIQATRVQTDRLTVNVLEVGGRDGIPVVLVHGNISSALFWQQLMLDLPDRYRPIAIDLRGFGGTDPEPVDATRGVRDYSDDVRSTLAALQLDRVHVVGWSLGGGVVLQCLRDDPAAFGSVALINPVSPFGFGGTFGVDGVLADPPGLGAVRERRIRSSSSGWPPATARPTVRSRPGTCCWPTTSSRRSFRTDWTTWSSRC